MWEVFFFDHHPWSIFLNNNLLILHKYSQMAPPHKIDALNDVFTSFSFSSHICSSSPTATALTEAMSESVPFFQLRHPPRDFCWYELKKILAATRFEPWTFRSNPWWNRPQDHVVLQFLLFFCVNKNTYLHQLKALSKHGKNMKENCDGA